MDQHQSTGCLETADRSRLKGDCRPHSGANTWKPIFFYLFFVLVWFSFFNMVILSAAGQRKILLFVKLTCNKRSKWCLVKK